METHKAISINNFLSLLQFTDGLFPAGAYAHSFGLEYYVQSGEVRDAEGVQAFLRAYLEGSVAPSDAVALLCAWRAAKSGDLGACVALDETLDAMKTVSEMREASRQMGRQTLRVATSLPCSRFLSDFSETATRDVTPGHHPVVFGIIGSEMNWPASEMVGAYLYSTSAALVGAALRLMPLGQLAGQRILWNVGPMIAKLVEDVQSKSETDMWTFTPTLEIAGMRHAMLEARLFRS